MGKFVCTLLTASILVSGSAFAQSKAKSSIDKQPLRDSQMDEVTAGSAVAVADGTVTSSDTGSVNLSGSSLSSAAGVNIVNSSNSLVANGVNVYDSSLASQNSTNGAAVNQINAVKQSEGTATVAMDLGLIGAAKATATNIAADSAKIDTNTNDSVTLTGSVEQNATALNIVNSAGGMVSNGVNIAHSSNMNAMPTLNQVNITSQSR